MIQALAPLTQSAQKVNATTSGSAATTAFEAGSTVGSSGVQRIYIRVVTEENVYFDIGDDPTASSSTSLLLGPTTEYLSLRPGQKIAFRAQTTDTTVCVTPTTI